MKKTLHRLMLGLAVASLATPLVTFAQTDNELIDTKFPDLSRYLNASQVLQAAVFDEIVAIPQTRL